MNPLPSLTLILGGARSGKSTFALTLIPGETEEVWFLATAEALDDDMRQRIDRHQAERPPHWRTMEEPLDLAGALERTPAGAVVVIDCLTLWVSNWMMKIDSAEAAEERLRANAERLFRLCRQRRVICVSNEVGLGIVPDTHLGRAYRDCLGRINQRFAAEADDVHFLVAGLPMKFKSSV